MLSFEIPPRPLNLLLLVNSLSILPDSQIKTIHSTQYSMMDSLKYKLICSAQSPARTRSELLKITDLFERSKIKIN